MFAPIACTQAVADCSRAVALNPSYAKAHSRLATLLAELGYHSDAASSLEAALATPGVCFPRGELMGGWTGACPGGLATPLLARCAALSPPAPPHPRTLQLPSADKRDYQQRLKGEKAAESRAISRASVFNGGSAPVDHYKLLGLERGAAAEEVRTGDRRWQLVDAGGGAWCMRSLGV